MFLKMRTQKFTVDCWDKIERLCDEIKNADAVVIGAGAGLSASAGFDYSGERFKRYFSDFAEKYGIRDMYTGGFFPFESAEEYWAYWSRYVLINRYDTEENGTYKRLFELIEGKDYFVLTTNVDHRFQKAGFDKHRLFYTQGDYGLFQCSLPCCQEAFDNEGVIREMVKRQENMRIPSELIPKCPKCGRAMTMNLRADNSFVQDEGWYRANERYEDFIRRHRGLRTLFLELGVGYNTPAIIKYPFWQMTAENPENVYACINFGEAAAPAEIERQSVCINGDIGDILGKCLILITNCSIDKADR